MFLSRFSARQAKVQDDGRLSLYHPNVPADGSMGPLTIEMLGSQVILLTWVLQFKCFHWSVFCSGTMKIVMLMHRVCAFVLLYVLQILTPCLQSSLVLVTTGVIIIIIINIIIPINNMWWETVWAETTMHHIHTHSVGSSITTEFCFEANCLFWVFLHAHCYSD